MGKLALNASGGRDNPDKSRIAPAFGGLIIADAGLLEDIFLKVLLLYDEEEGEGINAKK